MKGKHSNEKKKNSILLIIFRLICLIVMGYSLFMIYKWHKENVENDNLKNSFENSITEEKTTVDDKEIDIVKINFEELLQKNSRTVGWVKVNNSNINFPIVQADDNTYYLTHNFENNYNTSGWIYMDYRNNSETLDPNTIIYGHNRRNDSMFGTLKNALNTSWCDNQDNRYISFSTLNGDYIAQIFSVYKVNVNNFSVPNNFVNTEEYQKYLNEITNKSYYNFDTAVTSDDKILTLYTCDDNTSYRVLVHAKLLQK